MVTNFVFMLSMVGHDVLCYKDIGICTIIVMFKAIMERLTTSRKYRGIKFETKVELVKGVAFLLLYVKYCTIRTH